MVKKKERPRSGGGKQAQLGIFDDVSSEQSDASENDEDLEKELAALLGEEVSPKPKSQNKDTTGGASMSEIDRMVSQAMNDNYIQVDDEDEGVVEDGDEQFLTELQDLIPSEGPSPAKQVSPKPPSSPSYTPPNREDVDKTDVVSILAERLELYKTAVNNAEANGDESKVKRYTRALQTLKTLDRKLKSGKKIDPLDIPSPVPVGNPPPTATPQAPSTPEEHDMSASQVSKPNIHSAEEQGQSSQRQPIPAPRRSSTPADQNRSTGPISKPNIQKDPRHAKLREGRDQYKQAAFEAKQMGKMELAKEHLMVSKQFQVVLDDFERTGDVDLSDMPPPPNAKKLSQSTVPAAAQSTTNISYPRDALEALQQRLDKYKQSVTSSEGNPGKTRRMSRIVMQYEDAIKKQKAGRPVDYDELPCPPGYPAIPTKTVAKSKPQPPTPAGGTAAAAQANVKKPSKTPDALKPTVAKQLDVLQRRKKQFMAKALEAKKLGDLDEAKRFLRMAKGFDTLIEKSREGFPVNLATIPDLPKEEEPVEIAMECNEELTGDRGEMFARLQISLKKQIQMCKSNRLQFSQLGNITEVKKFEQMALHSKQDLDTLVNAHSHGDPIPRFHYEYRTLPILRMCSDLGENQAEVTIVRGVQYNAPSGAAKELDTYVKFEFPFPSDNSPSDKTHSKTGDSPEYEANFKLPINHSSRTFAGVVKRKSVKFEVFYRKGYFKSDGLLGTALLKLSELDKKCELHESIPLMEGRKSAGGKLEVKVRIHHPLSGIKHDFKREKWLVIDGSSTISSKVSLQKAKDSSKKHPNQSSSSICSAF